MMVKVCLAQESPIFFDKDKTIDKLESIVRENAALGCELIVFPESYIPGYPRGFSFGAVIGNRTTQGRKLYQTYYANSIDLQSEDGDRLIQIAKEYNCYLVIGITEKENNTGSLYCSMVYISPTEGILGVHRKIKPTGTERLIWAEAGGESLVTFDTMIGKLGGLICWENYMPLARMSMYRKGVELYIAPTADSRDEWISTMKHIALEGRCFVLACNQYFTSSMYPSEYSDLSNLSEDTCPGGSVIISPLGKIIEGPLYGTAGCLIATLDLDEIVQSKLDFDVIGHYSRDDIFTVDIKGQPSTYIEKSKARTIKRFLK